MARVACTAVGRERLSVGPVSPRFFSRISANFREPFGRWRRLSDKWRPVVRRQDSACHRLELPVFLGRNCPSGERWASVGGRRVPGREASRVVSVVSRTAWFAQGRMIQCVTTTQNPSSAWLSVPAENASARGSPSRCRRASFRQRNCAIARSSVGDRRSGADYRLAMPYRARDAQTASSGGWQTVSARAIYRSHTALRHLATIGELTRRRDVTPSHGDPFFCVRASCCPCGHGGVWATSAGAADLEGHDQASFRFERRPWLL